MNQQLQETQQRSPIKPRARRKAPSLSLWKIFAVGTAASALLMVALHVRLAIMPKAGEVEQETPPHRLYGPAQWVADHEIPIPKLRNASIIKNKEKWWDPQQHLRKKWQTMKDQALFDEQRRRVMATGHQPPPVKAKAPNRTPDILLPKPIIVVGYPKAGTSSIFNFFARNHLPSQHYFCCDKQLKPDAVSAMHMSECLLKNLARNRTILKECGYFDVFGEINGPRPLFMDLPNFPNGTKKPKGPPSVPVENWTGHLLEDGTYNFDGPFGPRIFLPQHFHLDKLHEHAPNATWILNTRPVDDWVKSVMKWDKVLPLGLANEYYHMGAISGMPKNDDSMAAFLSKAFVEHNQLVRNFVKEHPSHALIELDITHPDAGKILGEIFGLNSSHWARLNQAKDKRPKFAQAQWPPSKSRWSTLIGKLNRPDLFVNHGIKLGKIPP